VTWPKGEKVAQLALEVRGDSTYEPDETLWVSFSEPEHVLLPNPFFTVTLENDDSYAGADSGYVTPTSYPGKTLVWAEEFDGSSLSSSSWNYETGATGWGNNELQFYRNDPSNVRVDNGRMIITARKEQFGGAEYTSARVTTKGKREFQYGRIDIRAKLPKGQGLWPALWMLGANISQVGWPACGETDIMELIGHQPNKVHGTAHWGVQGSGVSTYRTGTYTLSEGDFSQAYHVFSLVWVENSLQFLVDDQLYHTINVSHVSPATYRHNAPFFFIANIAVGGNWPGAPDASTVFPQSMYVDYIRVFQ
jgi:beta-glucanase (GH16 family)